MKWQLTGISLAVALALSACGGGDQPELVPTTSVKVAGDSLSDNGVFGFRFTIQGTTTAPNLLWVEHVAAAVGQPGLCPHYIATSATTVAANPAASTCTNHAVAGGRINVQGTAGDATPFSIVKQLKDLAASGPYGAQELLLVDGGGNDLADLLGAYLSISTDGGASYTALLGELLASTQVQTAVAGGQAGLVGAGNTYMVALADLLADTLIAQALNQGAKRVVVITAPDVTVTPRFLGLLAFIGQSSPATATAIKGVANGWVTAFNERLKTRLSSYNEVAVVDFYAQLNQWTSQPTQFGLTNTTSPACPATGTDGTGLPTYTIQNCTATLLSTAPYPAGETQADWWTTYVFADNFHGSPRLNALMGQTVTQTLEAKRWR
ncbi:MAG: hypothetical protein RLZZ352_1565 [Pseudomonadota bacterium]|jgi:phospholipase/lecithinase/hemolysin